MQLIQGCRNGKEVKNDEAKKKRKTREDKSVVVVPCWIQRDHLLLLSTKTACADERKEKQKEDASKHDNTRRNAKIHVVRGSLHSTWLDSVSTTLIRALHRTKKRELDIKKRIKTNSLKFRTMCETTGAISKRVWWSKLRS